MTKYEILYGVTVDHFPNEKENVLEKLRLATLMRNEVYKQPYNFEQQTELHELNQSIEWCRKILSDIEG